MTMIAAMKVVLYVALFVYIFHPAEALQCYTCSIGENDVDTTCVDDPAGLGSGGQTNCNKKYCTTIRQEFKDPQGKVASMYRGCDDDPIHMNEIIEDETYRIYYTACQQTLCNGGTGKASDGSSSTSSLGDKSNLMVPGISGASSLIVVSLSIILSIVTILHFI